MPIRKIDLYLFDERSAVGAKVTLPPTVMHDVDTLLAEAQKLYPTYSHEALVRYVWVRGLDALRRTIESGKLPHPDRVPAPATGLLRSDGG